MKLGARVAELELVKKFNRKLEPKVYTGQTAGRPDHPHEYIVSHLLRMRDKNDHFNNRDILIMQADC